MSPRKSFIATLLALFLFALPNPSFAEYGSSPAPELHDSCLVIDQQAVQSKQKTYECMYQDAWSALNERYFFRQNMGDWNAWQHKFDGKLTTLAETESAIKELVKSLKDQYTFFLDGKGTSDKEIESKKTGIVTCELLEYNIGYLKIASFGSRNAAKETYAALQTLHGAKALILDLQDNHGGWIDEAIHATSFFLKEGLFCSINTQYSPTVRRTLTLRITQEQYSSVSTGVLTERHEQAIGADIPIVILVNGDTASASEMLAGCLQEHKRATLMGRVTLGKGVCQDLKKLPVDTTLRYTYAQWNLPVSNTCIHKKGIAPDVLLQSTENAKETAVKLIRSKYVINKP